jgi:hypothetical protein
MVHQTLMISKEALTPTGTGPLALRSGNKELGEGMARELRSIYSAEGYQD